ncbi:MAG TPA: WG repeat-containing protein [Ignavibacteria bacterium]|nr:WG repeat-containing protein [Ignavibacteria bacterium]HRF67052.1 WG repeat-containing protein [Ignavibacteria bacterium]HRJ04985.1 WG repeat-containing protein [Ignavibacteria bacterium]
MNSLFFFILLLFNICFAFSQSPDTLYPVKVFTESGYKYGYINNQGYLSIKPQYAFAKDFNEGLAFVKSDNNSNVWDCINTSGVNQFQINAKYVYDFNNGQAKIINENDNIFFINKSGTPEQFITPPIDLDAKKTLIPFYDNMKWGYRLGPDVVVLPAIYERAGEFSEGLAQVFIMFNESDLPTDNCYNAFINLKGDVIIKAELKYDDKGFLESGYFFSPGKWQNGVCRYYTSNDPSTRVEKYIRSDGKIIW